MSEHGGITRRALLTLAASAAGLAGVAVVGIRWRLPDYDELPPNAALDAMGRAVLRRCADYFLPQGQGFPAVDAPALLGTLDVAIGQLDASVRGQVLLGLKAFELTAMAHAPWRAFSELDDGQAQTHVERWLAGAASERALVAALRQLVHVAYWQRPDTWAAAHYPGPMHLRADVPALGPAPRPQS